VWRKPWTAKMDHKGWNRGRSEKKPLASALILIIAMRMLLSNWTFDGKEHIDAVAVHRLEYFAIHTDKSSLTVSLNHFFPIVQD
jgi:hypothetical protein